MYLDYYTYNIGRCYVETLCPILVKLSYIIDDFLIIAF